LKNKDLTGVFGISPKSNCGEKDFIPMMLCICCKSMGSWDLHL
jgi:hypothetical protein